MTQEIPKWSANRDQHGRIAICQDDRAVAFTEDPNFAMLVCDLLTSFFNNVLSAANESMPPEEPSDHIEMIEKEKKARIEALLEEE